MELESARMQGKGSTIGPRKLDLSKIKCFTCGSFGHMNRDCSSRRREEISVATVEEEKY